MVSSTSEAFDVSIESFPLLSHGINYVIKNTQPINFDLIFAENVNNFFSLLKLGKPSTNLIHAKTNSTSLLLSWQVLGASIPRYA